MSRAVRSQEKEMSRAVKAACRAATTASLSCFKHALCTWVKRSRETSLSISRLEKDANQIIKTIFVASEEKEECRNMTVPMLSELVSRMDIVPVIFYDMAVKYRRYSDVLRWLVEQYPSQQCQRDFFLRIILQGEDYEQVVRDLITVSKFPMPSNLFFLVLDGHTPGTSNPSPASDAFLAWIIEQTPVRNQYFIPMVLAVDFICIKTLQELHEKGCKWSRCTYEDLVDCNRFDLMTWMHSQGLIESAQIYSNERCLDTVLAAGNYEVLVWLYEEARMRIVGRNEITEEPRTITDIENDIEDPQCREFWREYGQRWLDGTFDFVPVLLKPARRH